jgi:hypothetical protein
MGAERKGSARAASAVENRNADNTVTLPGLFEGVRSELRDGAVRFPIDRRLEAKPPPL